MPNILSNKPLLIIAGVIILLLVIMAFPFGKKNTPKPTPTSFISSPIPSSSAPYIGPNPTGDFYSEDYKKQASEVNKQEEAQLKKDKSVSEFIDSLPYRGQKIEVTYAISDNSVTLRLQSGKEAEGNKEFEELLKKYNIEDKSWIQNFKQETK